MSIWNNKNVLNFILYISIFAILFAFYVEFILGHKPCNLCLFERIPYGLSLVLISAIFILRKNEKFFTLLLIITFVFSLAISFYHYGIEQGFFEESAVCGVKDLTENITKKDLLKQLSEKTVSCKDVTFRILGLSLTSINIIVSLIFIIAFIKIYNNYEKNKQ